MGQLPRQMQRNAFGILAARLNPIAAGCAVLLATIATPASAQETQSKATDASAAASTVIVTGIRRGIEDAISVKKNSLNIVESISAEDIGKLPDTSIAESIARLPGLAAQRVAGRAQVISVRGLSPDFATTLLNGREQVSTGDNRSVEFDQYPSELLSGVTVYKTPDAGVIGQGLSGTIDMQTVRPLSFPGRTLSMNLRGERNSLGSIADASATGHRFSISYIDQFANRTLGVAIGFANLESPHLDHEVGLYEPWKTDARAGLPAGTYEMDGIKSLAKSGRTTRNGLMGVVEWAPSKEWRSTLDLFASNFHEVETANQFEFNLGGYNGNHTPSLNYDSAMITNGTLNGGVASGIYPLVRGEYNNREDAIRTVGWANKFKFKDWSLLADVNYSRAKRDEIYQEINMQRRNAAGGAQLDTMTVNWATGGFPTLYGTQNYSDPSQLFTGNSIYGAGYGRTPHIEDSLRGYKLIANFASPALLDTVFSEFEVGMNYTGRTKKKRQPEAAEQTVGAQVVSPDLLYASTDLGFAGSGTIPSYNVPGVIAKYFDPFNPDPISPGAVARAWDVTENITTAYIKGNLETHLGVVEMKGNVGVQVQHTDQSSASVYTGGPGGVLTPVNIGKTYTDVLPSLNLAFDLGNDQTLRFAAAKQLARARIDQMRASFDFHIDDTTRMPSANGGNPKLDPWKANAFDVSYEKYFGKKAYVAAAAFYKNLTSYIYSQTKPFDFSPYTAGATSPAGYAPVSNIGAYTSEYNGQGGTLKGIELSVSLPLDLVSKSLDGFGVVASTTYTDSSITIPSATFAAGTNIPLPGLSKNVTNLTAYYEKNGFSSRISQRRRSDYVGEIGNFAGDRNLRYVVGEKVVDLQIGYAFSQGMYSGLSLLLQVNNLTDQAYRTYQTTQDHPLEYQKYGRTFLAGASYKF